MITIEDDDDEQTYSDLMQFPLPSTDSLTENLIAVHQSGNLTHSNTIEDEVDSGEESPVIDHWSHPEHKLFLLEELQNADNSNDDDEGDTNSHIDEMLVCNGCIQPISTTSDKHYYGCIGCNFFLHTTCANHLPSQFHPGKCDPEHTLKLQKYPARPLKNAICYSCCAPTNGFTYRCYTCPSLTFICIFCCLTPDRIKHEYHKHPLVQRCTTTKKTCNACLEIIRSRFEYGCETCSDIQIHQSCAMSFPKIITQRWDSHSIALTYPPIYYKGLRYCEKCELEVNQEAWLYRCSECDQCFHPLCIRQPHNMKLGEMVASSTRTLHPHTLTLKMMDRNRYPERFHKYLSCREKSCPTRHSGELQQLCLECAGCNYLICINCSQRELLPPEARFLNQRKKMFEPFSKSEKRN